MTGPALVYILCLGTCIVCAGLLIRSCLKTRTRLLLWAAASFVCLAVINFFLLADTTLFPAADLSYFRFGAALVGISILIFGLVWEAE